MKKSELKQLINEIVSEVLKSPWGGDTVHNRELVKMILGNNPTEEQKEALELLLMRISGKVKTPWGASSEDWLPGAGDEPKTSWD